MQAWLDEGYRLLSTAFGDPGDALKFLILAALAMVVFIGVMNRAGHHLAITYPDRGALFILLAGAFVALLVNTFLHLRVIGESPQTPAVVMLTVFTVLGVILAVGAPLTCLFQKANYFRAVLSVLLSAAATVGAVLLVGLLLDALWKSDIKFKQITRPSDGISDFFLGE
ncbi:MAG: hypothetical protein BWZ02_01156 [Lentisphaerae bacterium ADurb.BinA184]|nr:MAG: hypothetical protein BWZ02_01156 [Lentisphaerae bacterium ADurb.BinA184]